MAAPPPPINIRLAHLFRIGIGPSSSHTVGPMRAALFFRDALLRDGVVPTSVTVALKGSLGATGRGHHSDLAVMAGLHGWTPDGCDPAAVLALRDRLAADPALPWPDGARVLLDPADVRFLRARDTRGEVLPHPNTMVFTALDGDVEVYSETWCSIGGGFIRRPEEVADGDGPGKPRPVPHPFSDAESLLARAGELGGTLGDVILANERALAADDGQAGTAHLNLVWQTFLDCISRGIGTTGQLPGGLGIHRRAGQLLAEVEAGRVDAGYAHIARGQAYAFAVQEENAAGGRVVTAPTNGAAGIVPAVLVEAAERHGHSPQAMSGALATAAAIAMLVKTNASISGAEVGCQGEVGTATSMAAAALCQLMGGTIDQVASAAEIGMEHNLGLTCDPIKGLVQAPCIERNAMGVAKAWSAAQLALHSVIAEVVSLDRVIQVMKRTGDDMRREYKETSEGGLAVNHPEC
ncbi:L-serine ammonia-lyase [soil metagenome]